MLWTESVRGGEGGTTWREIEEGQKEAKERAREEGGRDSESERGG